MSAGDFASAGMYVQNASDPSQDFIRVTLRKDNASSENFYADVFANGNSLDSVFIQTSSSSVTLAISYDSASHTLMAAYDDNGATNGYSFTSFLESSIADGVSNWGMTENDVFEVRIFAHTAQVPVSIGQITIDNFATSPTSISLVPITIDIKPRDPKNVVNPKSRGGIWVAILSDTDSESPFDPSSQVDISTAEFGPDGATVIRYKVKDINKDGIGDLLLHFKMLETGIACGDTEATLIGNTFDGHGINGTDSIKTVGCKNDSNDG